MDRTLKIATDVGMSMDELNTSEKSKLLFSAKI
jgi:hypothetical protein